MNQLPVGEGSDVLDKLHDLMSATLWSEKPSDLNPLIDEAEQRIQELGVSVLIGVLVWARLEKPTAARARTFAEALDEELRRRGRTDVDKLLAGLR